MDSLLCPDAVPSFLGFFDISIAPTLLFYSYFPIVIIALLLSLLILFKDKYSFLYLRSSNPSASDFQDIDVNGKPLFQVMAEKVATWKEENFGIIAPATYPQDLKILRNIFPNRFFLVPGIGAQGGDLEKTLKAGLTKNKSGLIINSSRGITFSENPREEALKLRNGINKYRL